MNNSYYETLDENFTQALNLYEKDFTHEELIDFLKSGNIVQKQIAAIRLDGVESVFDAGILVDNLTGQDGKVREAVSMRLNEFMSDSNYIDYFKSDNNYSVFLDAIIDINANICRNVISAVTNLKSDENFCSKFCPELVNLTNCLLDKVSEFDFMQGKYKVNKEVFKLYWCLETVYAFRDIINFTDLKNILLKAKDIEEYTIREKAAKILSQNFDDAELQKAHEELKNDPNYYVRRYFSKN